MRWSVDRLIQTCGSARPEFARKDHCSFIEHPLNEPPPFSAKHTGNTLESPSVGAFIADHWSARASGDTPKEPAPWHFTKVLPNCSPLRCSPLCSRTSGRDLQCRVAAEYTHRDVVYRVY